MAGGVTYREAAERTGVSVPALRMRVKRGLLKFRRAGKKVFIWEPDVRAMEDQWQGNSLAERLKAKNGGEA